MYKLVKKIPYYIKKPQTMEGKPSLIIDINPLLIKSTFKNTTYYIKKPFTIFQKQIPFYIMKPQTMEGKPSLTIEGNPLLIRSTFKKTHYYGMQLGLGGAVEY